MTSTYDMARGLIRIGIQRLAGDYPFHARTLERLKVTCREDISTMGVTVVQGEVQLLYNPDFVTEISIEELGGVLLHEVHHVVFGHILVDPARFPDRWARTVAEEVTVNEFVSEPLPGDPILLEQFPELPERESTDQRYQRLLQHKTRPPVSSMTLGLSTGGGSLVTVDDHSVWREALQDPQQSEAALRAVVQDAVIDVGVENVPEGLREGMRGLGIGRLRGRNQAPLAGTTRGRLGWVQLLRHFVGRHRTHQPDFRHPPRRYPHLIGVFPGRRRRSGRPHVLAVIDTSGSMTMALLEQVNGELSRLAADHQVTVAECDAAIQEVYPYRPIQFVHGRGGTDLRPPFEPGFIRTNRPDLVIYFTDGHGLAPAVPPPVPVLWCLTPHGVAPAAWGQVVRMVSHGGPTL